MKKKLLSLMITASLVASLVGCGGQTATTTDGTATETNTDEVKAEEAKTEEDVSESANEPVTLRFMWWGGDERAAATLDTINAFQAEYPWITIEAEYGSSDGYQEKLTTQLASGTVADIFQMGTGWMPGYVESNAGNFVDFKEYSDLIDLSNFESSFLANNGEFDGHQYGLPTGIAGQALIYNTDLAEKIGIDFNTQYTWNDLVEMGKKVKEYDESMTLLIMGSAELNTMIIRPYLAQLKGKSIIDNDSKSLNVSQEEMTEVFNLIQALYDNNVIAPITDVITYGDSLGTSPDWINQKYVAAFAYSSTIETFAAACPDGNFAAGKLPVMENALSDGWFCNCPQYMCVNANSPYVKEAVMFLNYFYNSEEAAKLLTTVRSVPPTSVGQSVCAELGILEGVAKESVDIIQTYAGLNDMGLTTEEEVTTLLQDSATQIAYKQDTPENVAESTMELLNNFLSSK